MSNKNKVSFYSIRNRLREEAPVNSTGPAIAGITGDPPVDTNKKKRYMILIRRKNTK